MKIVFVDADERLIAFHTPDNAPPLDAYASSGATEMHTVQDEAVRQVGVQVGPAEPGEMPIMRVTTVLAENWRDLIVALAEEPDA